VVGRVATQHGRLVGLAGVGESVGNLPGALLGVAGVVPVVGGEPTVAQDGQAVGMAEEEPAADGTAAMDGVALAEPSVEGIPPLAGVPEQGVQERVEDVAGASNPTGDRFPSSEIRSWRSRTKREEAAPEGGFCNAHAQEQGLVLADQRGRLIVWRRTFLCSYGAGSCSRKQARTTPTEHTTNWQRNTLLREMEHFPSVSPCDRFSAGSARGASSLRSTLVDRN
jgi:hypothetical protein